MARNPHGDVVERISTAQYLLGFRRELLEGGVSESISDELVLIAARYVIGEDQLVVKSAYVGVAEGEVDAWSCS